MSRLNQRLVGSFSQLLRGGDARRQSDAELLERFAHSRDEEAFRAIVERHGSLVLGACRRVLGDAHEAEDAFQATFLVLARKAGALRNKDALGGWLFGVARRLALQARSRKAARQRRDSERKAVSEAVPDEPSWREVLAALDEELAGLSEKYRAPLVLCYLQGKTQDEAARQLDWSKSTCRRRLEEGRRLLLTRLTRRGVALPAALGAAALAAGARPPVALSATTVKAAVGFASGSVAGAAALPPVLLAGWGLRALAGGKLKAALWAAAVLGALGTGVLAWRGMRPGPTASGAAEIASPGIAGKPTVPENPAPADREAPAVDLHGDPLPPGAVARLGTTRWSRVYRCLFARDRKTVVIYRDEAIALCDLDTGRERRRIARGHAPLALSPDGKILAVSSPDAKITLWDVVADKALRPIGDGLAGVIQATFSPNGKTLAMAGYTIRLWDVATGKERPAPRAQQRGSYHCLDFSPDGKLLAASGSQRDIQVWDAVSGKERFCLKGHRQAVHTVRFAPDGKTLASGAHSPTAGQDRDTTLRLWDVTTGKDLSRFSPDAGGVGPLVFSPDGKILYSGGSDWHVHGWDVATGAKARAFSKLLGISALGVSSDGKSLWAVGQFTARWDTTTGKERLVELGHQREITGLVFLPGGRAVITGGWDGTVRLWDRETGRTLRQEAVPEEWLNAVTLSADGRVLVTVGLQGRIQVREALTLKEVRSWEVRGLKIWSVALSPDGKVLAVAGEGRSELVLWDTTTGRELRAFPGPGYGVVPMAFSPDGTILATGVGAGSVQLLEAATGRLLGSLPLPKTFARQITFSPDGRTVAVGAGDTEVILFEVVTRAPRARLKVPADGVSSLAFSPDGRLVVGGGAGYSAMVHLWDVTTGKALTGLKPHERGAVRVAFSPDGRFLATGGREGNGLIWDVRRLARGMSRPKEAVTPEQLQAGWDDLEQEDAARAHRAVWTLRAAAGRAVPLLVGQLTAGNVLRDDRITELLAGLDDERFSVRKSSFNALARFGWRIEPRLRKVLQDRPSLEARRQLEDLLDRLESRVPSGEELRLLRAVEVLGYLPGPEAERGLDTLVKRYPGSRVAREAEKARHRMRLRPGGPVRKIETR